MKIGQASTLDALHCDQNLRSSHDILTLGIFAINILDLAC